MMVTPSALLPERIFLGNRRWVEGKALCIAAGKIVSVVDPVGLSRRHKVIELPGVALLPGLVDAHTHLEYTDASFKKPARPSFVAWLNAIKSWKAKRSERDVANSLKRGVDQLLKSGVVAVGDHYCGAKIPRELTRSPLKGVVFHEAIGLNPSKAPKILAAMKIRRTRFSSSNLRFGVALHAPYSVSALLARETLSWVKAQSIPLSMHVGESREEGELFRHADNDLARWLQTQTGMSFGVPRGKDLFAYLEGLDVWQARLQTVHMNLAKQRHLRWMRPKRLSVVYCPKSHEYFRHPRFSLELFLHKGYCVALGTDSLASNDALNMWEELRLAQSLHPSIPLETLWDMATVHGARSLGLEKSGKIHPGHCADLIGIPASRTRHPLEEVFRHTGDVAFSMIDGKVCARTRQAGSLLLR